LRPNLIFITISFLAIHCTCVRLVPLQNKTDFRNVAENKFGKDFQGLFNKDSSYVLVINQKKATAQNPFPFLNFFIYDLSDNKIVLDESLPNSRIVWKNNYQVEVITTPEVISTEAKNNNQGYIYDLQNRTRSKRK